MDRMLLGTVAWHPQIDRHGSVFLFRAVPFDAGRPTIVLADRAAPSPTPQWCCLWCYLYRMRAARPPRHMWRAIKVAFLLVILIGL